MWTDDQINFLIKNYKNTTAIEIARILNRSVQSVRIKAHKLNIKRDIKYDFNENFFEKADVNNCYWAGFLAADGNVQKAKSEIASNYVSVEIALKDKEHLEKFCKEINRKNNLITRTQRLNNKIFASVCLKLYSNKLVFDLEGNFNIVPKKSLILTPPNLFEKNMILSYIAGYIDGDGYIELCGKSYFSKKSNSYKKYQDTHIEILGTKDILTWIKFYIDAWYEPKINSQKSNVRSKENIFKYSFSGHRAKEFVKEVKGLNLPILNRKWTMDNKGTINE